MKVSTHSPRGGRTLPPYFKLFPAQCFNSLAPRGANQTIARLFLRKPVFQLTRPAGGEPGDRIVDFFELRFVSTHSPRGGRTASTPARRFRTVRFNSLAPRGANPKTAAHKRENSSFNSLAPLGANRYFQTRSAQGQAFQLTRPAWGEPWRSQSVATVRHKFQLTRPAGGEPLYPVNRWEVAHKIAERTIIYSYFCR